MLIDAVHAGEMRSSKDVSELLEDSTFELTGLIPQLAVVDGGGLLRWRLSPSGVPLHSLRDSVRHAIILVTRGECP